MLTSYKCGWFYRKAKKNKKKTTNRASPPFRILLTQTNNCNVSAVPARPRTFRTLEFDSAHSCLLHAFFFPVQQNIFVSNVIRHSHKQEHVGRFAVIIEANGNHVFTSLLRSSHLAEMTQQPFGLLRKPMWHLYCAGVQPNMVLKLHKVSPPVAGWAT